MDDMMMVLEAAGEATPTRSRPERHPNSNPSYIISAYLLSLYLTVTLIAAFCRAVMGSGAASSR